MKKDSYLSEFGSVFMLLAEADTLNDNEQWVHIVPKGKFEANDGRGFFFVDNPQEVIELSLKRAGSKLIPIDYDHQIDFAEKNGQPGIAAGWIKSFESRDNGIWALVEWTKKALSHVSNKEYRYISPVLLLKQGTHEVIGIKRASLTNKPALEMTALASEETDLNAELLAEKQELLARQESFKAQQVEHLVHMAAVQGRILPRHKEFAEKLCQIDTVLFNEFVDSVSPFIAPLFKEIGYGDNEHTVNATTTKLNETAELICSAMGHSKEEFINLGVSK